MAGLSQPDRGCRPPGFPEYEWPLSGRRFWWFLVCFWAPPGPPGLQEGTLLEGTLQEGTLWEGALQECVLLEGTPLAGPLRERVQGLPQRVRGYLGGYLPGDDPPGKDPPGEHRSFHQKGALMLH